MESSPGRRSSVQSQVELLAADIINGRNFESRSWFDHYLSIVKGQTNCNLEAEHLCDILKLLYDDTISDLVLVHLLNIMEQRIDLLEDKEEILEQVVGTFLNFYSTCTKLVVKKKILSTSTSLFVYHRSMVRNSIQGLFDSLVKILLRESGKEGMSILCRECLSAIHDVFPESFDPRDKSGRNILPVEDLKERLIKDPTLPTDVTPEVLQHALHDVVQLVKEDPVLTPAIFKPFISQFCYSSELYQVHFLVILLQEFQLQLFTDDEERLLLNQLAVLSRHLSLLVSHRLFALDFISSLMRDFGSAFDHRHFLPTQFDGPDTLEKKLQILMQVPQDKLSDDEFLLQLQPLQSLSLETDNTRATKSMYRVLSAAMERRETMISRVEGIVICLILASPRHHIRYSLDLMTQRPDLSQRVASIMLRKILSSDEALAQDHEDQEQLFLFIEWLLKRQLVTRTDDQMEQLFKFLHRKSIENPSLVSLLLSCSAAAIRSYELSPREKELLRTMLSFVSREGKDNVTLTSWAQIYSIAITALSGVENIRYVFDTEDMSCLRGQGDYVLKREDCPIRVSKRAKVTAVDSSHSCCDKRFDVEFDVSLAPSASFQSNQVFALSIDVKSTEQGFRECWETPLLSVRKTRLMKLLFQLKRCTPFDLLFDCQFNDLNGSVYMCRGFHVEKVPFSEILAPVDSVSDLRSFRHVWKQISLAKDSCLETVMPLNSVPDCDALLERHPFLTPFCLADGDRLLISLTVLPKSRILLTARSIEGRVSLHAITDDPESLLLMQQQVTQSLDDREQ